MISIPEAGLYIIRLKIITFYTWIGA